MLKKFETFGHCNDCIFRPLPFKGERYKEPAYVTVEQIVKGAKLSLCRPHYYLYVLRRMWWRINQS